MDYKIFMYLLIFWGSYYLEYAVALVVTEIKVPVYPGDVNLEAGQGTKV